MPLYFFNVFHDENYLDDVGTELPDKHAAWEEATRVAGDSIKDMDGQLRPGHDWKLEITDEFRNPLWELHVKAQKR